jgi:methionyl aminopeptidase
MWQGIRQVPPGAHLGDIGFAIERHAKKNGYSVVREYCGHGIGREMHEEPQILNFGRPGRGLKLREGMVFTIEPMVNQGTRMVSTEERWMDGRDERPEALRPVRAHRRGHRTGVEVLTLRRDGT